MSIKYDISYNWVPKHEAFPYQHEAFLALKDKPYAVTADMSKFLASIIDFMNHDVSLTNAIDTTEKIQNFLVEYSERH